MRAAVVHELGTTPTVGRFDDPGPDSGAAEVIAAALNPVDVAIVAGQNPFRELAPPFVAGLEGVAKLDDGSHRYFSAPLAPYGSLAELVPLEGAETASVPENLSPVTAAALGTSALAAWLALMNTGGLGSGETVLVLGAEGQVGSIAIQIARAVGAGRIVGVVREESGRAGVVSLGADDAVSSNDLDRLTGRLQEAAPDGVDVILDLTWGPVVAHAIDVAKTGARLVQVGNSAGATATISAPVFRNKLVTVLPHSNFAIESAQRMTAFEHLAARAARGELVVDVETVPLAQAADAWQRLATGTNHRKLVVTPREG